MYANQAPWKAPMRMPVTIAARMASHHGHP